MTRTNRNTQASPAPAPFKLSRLASACVLATGALMATSAGAQSSGYSNIYGGAYSVPTWSVAGFAFFITTGTGEQFNSGNNSANVLTPGMGNWQVGGSSTNTVSSNSIIATARGNTQTNSQTMANLVNNGFGDDGLGIAASQTNGDGTGNGAQFASITGTPLAGTIFIQLQDTDAAAAQNLSSNVIRASSILNTMDSAITGIAPVGYVSGAAGQATATLAGGSLLASNSSGGLSVHSVQVSENSGAAAGSGASVADTVVRLDIHNPGGVAVPQSANLTVSNNAISAEYAANVSGSRISVDAGSAPITGAASVVNAQVNMEAASSASTTAAVSGAGVTADIRSTVAATDNQLSARLDLTSNAISATSRGNDAGNSIQFLSGSAVTGTGTAPGNTGAATNAALIDATVNADVAVANMQVNNTTTLASDITTTAITAATDSLTAGGVVNVTSNSVASRSTGNNAANVVAGTATSYDATTGIGSSQANDGMVITAANTGTTVSATTGIDGVTTTGTVNVSSNNISSAATGSANSSTVTMSPTNTINASTAGSGAHLTTTTGNVATSTVTAGVSINTTQANTIVNGASTISATLSNANVVNQSADTVVVSNPDVTGSTFAATGNTLTAVATGNTNTNTGTLSGAQLNVTGAVASTQFNAADVSGTISSTAGNGTGVQVIVGNADTSNLSASSNSLTAAGTGNNTANTLNATANAMTAIPSAYAGAVTADATATTGTANSNAAFSVTAVQHNEGAVTSSNRTRTDFATITAGVETSGTGITASTLTVTGNQATSTTAANVSVNSLSLAPGLLTTADGESGQIASVANLQNNAHGNIESSRVGGQGGAGQLVGITYLEGVDAASTLTVTGNTLRATSRGNDTSNSLVANVGAYAAAATTAASNGNISSADNLNVGAVAVTSDFALVNNQNDNVAGRTATADNIVVSVDDAGGTVIQNMNGQVMLAGNTVTAEARNNNAGNTLALTGSTGTVNTSAGLINQQVATTPLTATTETTFRVRASGVVNAIGDGSAATAITLSGNQANTLAVGNSATNAVTASGVSVTGNAVIAAGGQSYDATTTATVADADFGAVNVQTQTGAILAQSTSSVRTILDGSQVVSTNGPTQLTMTGNSVQTLAQANSARTTLDLAGTNTTASAAVANVQSAGGDVTATHTSPTTAANDTPGVLIQAGDPAGVTGATMTVTGNTISVSAGQNAADNWLQSNSTSLSGRGLGTNALAYDNTTGSGSATTDLSVMNIQQATGGLVSATTAQPGDIGASIELMDGGSLAVTGNQITATGTINNASNLIALDKAGAPVTVAVNATAGIVNGQLNAAGQTVTATVGDAALATNLGIRAEPTGPSLTVTNNGGANPVLNVTGNSTGASASGNIATNAISTAATASTNLATTGQTLAILSDQINNAALTSTTQNIAFGVNSAAANGGETSVTGATINVTGNNATATGGGNTATNTIASSADIIAGGDATVTAPTPTTASIAISNTQTNNTGATVTTMVDTITAGIDASGATTPGLVDGSTVNVLSNRMQAVGYGNNATNSLSVAATTGMSSDASVALGNTQTNLDAVQATAQNIRAGVLAGGNTISDVAGPTVVTVSGNQVSAIGGGSTAVSVLNGSAGAILSPSNTSPTFSLNSDQTNAGANSATAQTVTIGVTSGTLTGDSTVSVLSNRVQSSAYGNDDSNTMNLTATAGSASMFSGALTGTQTNAGAPITALTDTVEVGYVNTLAAGTVNTTTTLQVSGNIVSGTAGANTAANVLNMTAGMASGTPLAPNFALNHTQSNDVASPIQANVTNVRIGVSVTDAASTVTATGLNVLSNTIQSSGYANSASNTLNLTATAGSTTAFTGALNATQTNDATVASGVSAITVGPTIGGTATDTPMLISGNAVNAIGGGNTTTNVLNAISGAAFGTPTPAPMYALSNVQSNTGGVTVTALNVNIGAMPANIVSGGSVNFGVLGNSVTASGYGNSANNTVAVTTPLWGGAPVASAMLANNQSNTANISATVTSATIGVGLTSGSGVAAVGAQNVIVTGNSITAQAIGNSAVNRITSK